MAKDDGGNAFPQALDRQHGFVGADGMSLRDYFAAHALMGMLASDSSVDRTTVQKRVWAGVAYDFADAMIAERAKG